MWYFFLLVLVILFVIVVWGIWLLLVWDGDVEEVVEEFLYFWIIYVIILFLGILVYVFGSMNIYYCWIGVFDDVSEVR